MNVAHWRAFVFAVCTVGVVVAALNLLDVIGVGADFPWLGTGQPVIGRWGAYFGDPAEIRRPDGTKGPSLNWSSPPYEH
jgi:hypothetical protein